MFNKKHKRLNRFNRVKNKYNSAVSIARKIIFAVLRARQEVALYENKQIHSDNTIRILHIGDAFRGRDFIERLYGFLPERQVIGSRFVKPYPESLDSFGMECDLVMIETNRLYSENYRQAGYFTIPQWIEFGREVVKDPEMRYAGAQKSLKSDLNRICNSNLKVVVTRDHKDLDMFYEKMYLPYLSKRFGEAMIVKSRKSLKKDFLKGFLMIVVSDEKPITGAVVRIDDDTLTETTLAVMDGTDAFLKTGVSGVIDYHLHEWAASNNKCFFNVGHTRPFPLDGVFFNKRKWLMSVIPDQDGVMDMAVKICRDDDDIAMALSSYPFAFYNKSGLGVFCVCAGIEKAGINKIRTLWKRFWTTGLKHLLIVSPAGFSEKTLEKTEELFGPNVHLISNISQAIELQKGTQVVR